MKCKDPCVGSCGLNTECHVYNHIPQCTCLHGYVGNPFISCNVQVQCKNNSCFYYIVNKTNLLITNYFICNSKRQNYIYHTLFSFKKIYYKLNINYNFLLHISILLNLYMSSNKIQRHLRSSYI